MTTKSAHDSPILVTGAAGAVGSIGRNLTQMLLAKGYKVRAISQAGRVLKKMGVRKKSPSNTQPNERPPLQKKAYCWPVTGPWPPTSAPIARRHPRCSRPRIPAFSLMHSLVVTLAQYNHDVIQTRVAADQQLQQKRSEVQQVHDEAQSLAAQAQADADHVTVLRDQQQKVKDQLEAHISSLHGEQSTLDAKEADIEKLISERASSGPLGGDSALGGPDTAPRSPRSRPRPRRPPRRRPRRRRQRARRCRASPRRPRSGRPPRPPPRPRRRRHASRRRPRPGTRASR